MTHKFGHSHILFNFEDSLSILYALYCPGRRYMPQSSVCGKSTPTNLLILLTVFVRRACVSDSVALV